MSTDNEKGPFEADHVMDLAEVWGNHISLFDGHVQIKDENDRVTFYGHKAPSSWPQVGQTMTCELSNSHLLVEFTEVTSARETASSAPHDMFYAKGKYVAHRLK